MTSFPTGPSHTEVFVHDYLVSLLLGIVEGLTEFLPISSTAHLRITEALLHISLKSGYWKMYSVVIQLGAIMCVPVYFWGRIKKFLKTFPRGERGNKSFIDHPVTLVLIAFVVTAGPMYFLKKLVGANMERLDIMGAALLIGGIIMWSVDTLSTKPRIHHIEDMGLLQAIWIGAVQILSGVFPGTSRSMCTIAAGQTAGMSRASALEFSFFVSIPTMFVACGYEFLKTVHPGKHAAPEDLVPLHMTTHLWVTLGIGFIVSFIVSLIVVAWFMHWVRRRGFTPFAIYRIVVGILILIWIRTKGMPG